MITETRKLTREEIDLTVRRVARIVKIGMFMDRYPAELSGGQQQRVAIARTLAPEPSVLFMDEPLSNLDAKLRLEMRYELQRLHVETGSTFVYVTHDQMEAMTLATQICLIENGVLQQYDAPPHCVPPAQQPVCGRLRRQPLHQLRGGQGGAAGRRRGGAHRVPGPESTLPPQHPAGPVPVVPGPVRPGGGPGGGPSEARGREVLCGEGQ